MGRLMRRRHGIACGAKGVTAGACRQCQTPLEAHGLGGGRWPAPPRLCLSPWGHPWARDQSDGRGALPVGGAGTAGAAPASLTQVELVPRDEGAAARPPPSPRASAAPRPLGGAHPRRDHAVRCSPPEEIPSADAHDKAATRPERR
jgi:hypothetical protein